MRSSIFWAATAFISASALYAFQSEPVRASPSQSDGLTHVVTSSSDRRRPAREVFFERNAGQVPPEFEFSVHGPSLRMAIGNRGVLFWALDAGESSESAANRWIGMKFVGASDSPIVGGKAAECVVHRFVGADPKMWRMSNPTYRSLSQRSLYSHIDLVWRDGGGAPEFDLIVGPQGDPNDIEIEIIGADCVDLIEGRLIGKRQGFRMDLGAPKCWTIDAEGQKTPVLATLKMTGPMTVAFAFGSYDRSQTLVIDPIAVAYSTYVGGTMMDAVNRVKTGPAGETYVVGETFSPSFSFSGTPAINPAFGPVSAPTPVHLWEMLVMRS